MDNLIYERQQDIESLDIPDNAIVVGCGGVGYWVALLLTLTGVKHLHLFDFDNIEIHNLNRLPFTMNQLGKNKAILTKKHLVKIRPEIQVYANPEAFDPFLVTGNPKFLICCVDDENARNQTHQFCQEKDIKWINLACTLDHLTVTHRRPEWEAGSDEEGYGVPMWIGPAILTASLGVIGAIQYPEIDLVRKLEEVIHDNK